jgi:dTDP-4-amino-4,6-dideoxygalactose transaminase
LHRDSREAIHCVVSVQIYGQIADMDPILEMTGRYNLAVIEGACQGHGAKYFSKKDSRWRNSGSMGRAAALSFYFVKNLGTCGEDGAITTNDEGLAHKAAMLRDHGQSKKVTITTWKARTASSITCKRKFCASALPSFALERTTPRVRKNLCLRSIWPTQPWCEPPVARKI